MYRIGGIEVHIHIVTHVHPTVAVAYLIKDIKIASSDYIKSKNIFPNFKGWQDACQQQAGLWSIYLHNFGKRQFDGICEKSKRAPSKSKLQGRIYKFAKRIWD